MTSTDDGDRPVDRFEAARNTALQHRDGSTCFHCQTGGCRQHAWAIEELARHPGGRKLLRQLGFPISSDEVDRGRSAAVNTPPSGASHDHAPHLYEHQAPREPARPVRAVGSAAAHTTTRLADEFFYLAHDDQTGRPRLFESATAHGLAAALLAELYREGRVTFEGRHVRVLNASPPKDWLQHFVLDRLVAEPRHTATRTWLAFLATTACEQVATRMWQLGLLRPEQVGRLWRHRTVYVPTDVNTAAWSWARLSFQLRNYHPLTAFDQTLAGLALHTQLDPILLDGTPLAVRAFLRHQVDQVPAPLRDLLADLGAVVGGAVLSHRTS